jgi:hypothetical protein
MGHWGQRFGDMLRHYAGLARIFKLSLEIGRCGCQGLEKANDLAFAV